MADESGTTSSGEVTLEPTAVVRTPRRRALWGVLAVVAVAAGALAVAASGDDDSLPTLPVALGASGRESAATGGAAPAADMAMMAWITYVAGDDLPVLGGEGPAYRLEGAVDEARVRALADALGVAGDPVHEDGYWHLQTGDAILEVYEDGGSYWWYGIQTYEIQPDAGGGSTGCEPGPAVDCAVAVDTVAPDGAVPPATSGSSAGSCTSSTTKDGTAVEECVATGEPCPPDASCTVPVPVEPPPVQPPADLPSEDEARGIALDLLRASGMDVEDAVVTVDGPYDAWYVTVEPVLDGLPVSGWVSSVSVGSKGAITNASGTLATPELLGDYPLLDTRAAIDRMNEQQQAYDDVRPLGAPTPLAADSVGTAEAAPAADPAPTTIVECTTEPDGAEACSGTGGDPGYTDGGVPIDCGYYADPGSGSTTTDGSATAPPIASCPPPPMGCVAGAADTATGGDEPATTVPECGPYPEPEPVEVVLHDAERVLVLLPAFDGSGDSYLLSGYRFTGDDGAIAETAAVADESLAPTTTVPDTTETTPPPPAPTRLEPGQTPEIGVGYYVEVITHCVVINDFGGRWWAGDDSAGDIQESIGTLTLTTPDQGTFSTESGYELVFTAQGPSVEYPGCD